MSTLEEVALHQLDLERIELLGRLCPKLKILYLQNNLIRRLENLHKLKVGTGAAWVAFTAAAAARAWRRVRTAAFAALKTKTRPRHTPAKKHKQTQKQHLEYLNLAVNNVTKVQNLARCEALAKLDLTLNFVPKAGLLSLRRALGANHALRELHLLGNPCAEWRGYRAYVIAALPQLGRLVRLGGWCGVGCGCEGVWLCVLLRKGVFVLCVTGYGVGSAVGLAPPVWRACCPWAAEVWVLN